ncbi:hypothetical protein PanWU01x14_253500, partial [Parasponia andersonii]
HVGRLRVNMNCMTMKSSVKGCNKWNGPTIRPLDILNFLSPCRSVDRVQFVLPSLLGCFLFLPIPSPESPASSTEALEDFSSVALCGLVSVNVSISSNFSSSPSTSAQ